MPPLCGLDVDHDLACVLGPCFRLSDHGVSDLGLCLRLCGLGLGELGVSLLLSYLGLTELAFFLRPYGRALVLVFLASSFRTLLLDALAVRYLLLRRFLPPLCRYS